MYSTIIMSLRNLVYCTFAFFLLAGCSEDFLDKPLQNQLTQENFPETPEDALAATNAAYETLRVSTYHRGFFPIDDIMSDDARKGSNPGDQSSALGPFDDFQFTNTSEFVKNWWRTLYEGIRRTNLVINRVPDIAMEVTVANRYIAQAKFLRALYYADLVRGYGGVPIVLGLDVSDDLTRSSGDEVYALIESDLRDAITKLPLRSELSANDLGRATQGAAQALLARAYLYQHDYDSALFFALEVINSLEYDLEADFDDANGVLGEYGIESVFEAGGIGTSQEINAGANQYALGQGVRGAPNRGFGFNRPSIDLINSFEANDPRMESTVIFLGEVIDGVEILGDPGTPNETRDTDNNLIEIETYNQKVWVPGTTVTESMGHNRRLIRYAEVLLIAAEAHNELNNPSQALLFVNRIRERAREGDATLLPGIATQDQSELKALILEERRHELAMEGHRFWDLVRTNTANEILGEYGFQVGKHELLPIPQTERDITQGRLEQNPGWN